PILLQRANNKLDNFRTVILGSNQAKNVGDAAHRCDIFKAVNRQKNKLKRSSYFLLVTYMLLSDHVIEQIGFCSTKSLVNSIKV
ncbi:MAG: hypothetical protein AAGK47_10885, partial [Bacteroidota bacterium]